MDRAAYNACVSEHLKQQETNIPQKRRFCQAAKECAKGVSHQEAVELCSVSMSQPKKKKHSSHADAGLRLVLLAQTGCKPCSEAKAILQEHIDNGIVEVLDIAKSDEAVDLVKNNKFNSVPKLLVLVNGKPFSELQITDSAETINV